MWTLFKAGGPVMWPILVCSILGLAVVINRFAAFAVYQAGVSGGAAACRKVIELVSFGKFEEALALARTARGAVGRIYAFALMSREYNLHDSLILAAQKEIDRLRRNLSLLDTVITVSPLLGILGTVTGIIGSFNMLNAQGIDNPAGVTSGIAEALITTAAGLIVAIAALLPFNFSISWIKRRTNELEQITHAFEVAYQKGMNCEPQVRV